MTPTAEGGGMLTADEPWSACSVTFKLTPPTYTADDAGARRTLYSDRVTRLGRISEELRERAECLMLEDADAATRYAHLHRRYHRIVAEQYAEAARCEVMVYPGPKWYDAFQWQFWSWPERYRGILKGDVGT